MRLFEGFRFTAGALALGFLVSVLAAPVASGQQGGRGFFSSKRNFFGWARHIEGEQLGETASFTAIGGSGLFLADNGVWMFQGEVLVSNDGDAGGSLGFGRRLWVGEDTIFGATVGYEANDSPYENLFRQALVSLELFHRSWSFRTNGYLPTSTRVERAFGPALTNPGQLIFSGNSLLTGSDILQIDETSMSGFDLEVAHDIGSPRAELFLGYHKLDGRIGEDTDGVRGGARAYLTPRLTATLSVSDDDLFGTNVYGGVAWIFGGSGTVPRTLEDKLTIPVERNTQVAVNAVDNTVSAQTPLTSQGANISVTHVSSGAAAGGDGSFENPFNSLSSAISSTDGIVYVGSGSVFNGEDFRLAPGQFFFGEGSGMLHQISTDQLGMVSLPSLNGTGLARPVINGAPGAAISLGNDSWVSNFDIFGSGTGIQADNLQGTARVDHVRIEGGFTGVDIIGGIGEFTFNDVEIENPSGVAFNVNGGSASISFTGDISKSTTGSTVEVTNHSGGTLGFDSGTIEASDGNGLQFNNTDGIYNFDAALRLNGGDAGIDILGSSNGTFRFSDASIVDPTGAAFNVNGGSASVTYGGDIIKSGAGSAIAITNHINGTLTFNSGSITATDGTGLQFNNTDGTYTFDSTVTLNGGDAGIDILGSSNGSFRFADASIVDPTGVAFNINGGGASVDYSGNITKNNPGSTIAITNHSGGTLTFRDGVISATSGNGLQFNNVDGSYAFNGNVTLNGGDAGIDILGSSNGSFSFLDATIINPGGTAFNVNGGSASVDFSGSITKSGLGSTVAITNHSGGTFTFGSGTIGATAGTGLQFNNANGTYTFNGPITLNGGDAGIDIFGNSNGTFLFADATITNPSGTAFNVEGLGPDGDIDFFGSIINDNSDLITIRTTVAGSSIRFNATGSNSLSGTGGGGILIVDADGEVSVAAPTTIVDPTQSFALAGISVSGGSGTVSFTDTNVQVLNPISAISRAVVIDSQNGTVRFTDLDVTTSRPGTIAFAATASNDIEVLGQSSIDATGGEGLVLDDIVGIDMTFDTVSITDSQAGAGIGSGMRLLNIGGGSLNIGSTTIDQTAAAGIEIDNSEASFTFDLVDIENTTGDAVAVGLLIGNPGSVTISGGTISNVGGDAIHVVDTGSFVVNNVDFALITGVTINAAGTSLDGTGNTSDGVSCTDGGGNSGAVSFDEGAASCP